VTSGGHRKVLSDGPMNLQRLQEEEEEEEEKEEEEESAA